MNCETFKIELTQVNKSNELTFQAIANNIVVRSEENLALEMADFCVSSFTLNQKLTKLGVKGLSKNRIKASQPLSVKLTCIAEQTEVSFQIASFGLFLKENLKGKKVQAAFSLLIEHTEKFSHLWS